MDILDILDIGYIGVITCQAVEEAVFDPTPPTEADLREFWGEKIFGQTDLYNPNAEWIPEWRKQNEKISGRLITN